MAVLDRYLEAMSKQRAEALVFRSGAPVEMVSGGNARPVSSKPASAEQIRGLFTEVLGKSDDGYHSYRGPFGAVAITLQSAPGGGVTARIEPAPAEDAPLELATPVPQRAAQVSGGGAAPRTLDELFHQMLDLRASDLHLKSGKVPAVRVDGGILQLEGRPPLDGETLNRFVHSIMPQRNQEEFKESNDTDFAYQLAARARMRCNVFRDLNGVGAVFRQIPQKILTARDLNLPRAVMEFCQFDKGLVVVTGPTGSGKSTTLAAMIDWINENRDDHLITIEDPVEFVHQDKKCLINQREVGTHTRGFKSALRAALRRTRTSCWSARCAIWRRWPSPSRRPRPGTWSSARCTPTPRPARWTGSSTSSPPTGSRKCAPCSPSRSRAWWRRPCSGKRAAAGWRRWRSWW